MLLPDELARANTEHAHQRAFFAWVALAAKHGFPAAKQICLGQKKPRNRMSMTIDSLSLFHAIPNGGQRNQAAAAKLKAEGVKPGVFDTFLPVPKPFKYRPDKMYSGLYIEFKSSARRFHAHGGLSAAQRAFIWGVQEQGYFAYVSYVWREAANIVMLYYDDDTRFEFDYDVPAKPE